jgi:outer membrane protein OmpA-like peptidoglycan-associated protein
MAKKRLEWHDSDAPDAKGKFKNLPAPKLAAWLTRNSKLNRIIGSLNQQINFNKDKPSYVAKMKRTRNIVSKKLKKNGSSK